MSNVYRIIKLPVIISTVVAIVTFVVMSVGDFFILRFGGLMPLPLGPRDLRLVFGFGMTASCCMFVLTFILSLLCILLRTCWVGKTNKGKDAR